MYTIMADTITRRKCKLYI